jgi:CoA:oxalate CoA-transferase
MDQSDLLEDERFATTEARLANTDALYDRIEAWAETFPDADSLVARMAQFGLTAARVRSVQENLDDPHLRERGALQPVDFPGVGEVLMQTAPYRMAGCTVAPGRPAGRVGADTDAVLRDVLALDADAVDELRAAGAVH